MITIRQNIIVLKHKLSNIFGWKLHDSCLLKFVFLEARQLKLHIPIMRVLYYNIGHS